MDCDEGRRSRQYTSFTFILEPRSSILSVTGDGVVFLALVVKVIS